jgi:NADP-dependent 3-hydroxy acid dehydrogenase YdfG
VHAFSGKPCRKSLQNTGIKVTLVEPGKTGSDLIEQSIEQQREQEALLQMLKAEDVAEAVCFCLTQSRRALITSLQIEPFRHQ